MIHAVRIAVIVVAAILAVRLAPQPASAETIGEMMAVACPAAVAMEKKYDRARAIDDDSQYGLARRAAALYYDCANRPKNPYARDWARYFYALSLWLSEAKNGEALSRAPIVAGAMNELAASTPFSDVRKAALKLKKDANDEYARIHDRVYGTPEPAPTSS